MRSILLLLLALATTYGGYKEDKAEYVRVRGLSVSDVSMSEVIDGTFRGEFALAKNMGKLVVDVTVENNTIISITVVENTMPKMEKKAYTLTDVIVAKNSPDVDAVSGATTTSVAIKDAVVNALSQGIITE